MEKRKVYKMMQLCGLELRVIIGGEEIDLRGVQTTMLGEPDLTKFLMEKALDIRKAREIASTGKCLSCGK